MHNTFLAKKGVQIYGFNKKGAENSTFLGNIICFKMITPP